MNTGQAKNEISRFSLGIEELSLTLGLINCPDLGRDLLKSIYDNLSQEAVEARLTSASHSLMARGLCGVSGKGSPILKENIEQAVFPLCRFDHLLHVSYVTGGSQTTTSVHVVKRKVFTSHFVQMGVIHVLEHGEYRQLPDYLADIFESFGENKQVESAQETEHEITFGTLGQALNKSADTAAITQSLTGQGWNETSVKLLVGDLADQAFRGTILRIDASSDVPFEQIKDAAKRTMLLLKSKKHSWLFEFPSAEDDALGKARLVTRKNFEHALAAFVL